MLKKENTFVQDYTCADLTACHFMQVRQHNIFSEQDQDLIYDL